MRRAFLALALLPFVAAPAFADLPHLRFTCEASVPWISAQPERITLQLRNDRADAHDVVTTAFFNSASTVTVRTIDSSDLPCVIKDASMVQCSAPLVPAGADLKTTLTVVVVGGPYSSIAITGTATARESIDDPEDARLRDYERLYAPGELTISGAGVGDEVSPDGTYAFRFTVAHPVAGLGTATNVKVRVTPLQGSLVFASASGADCTLLAGSISTVDCALPDIPDGGSSTFATVYRGPAFGRFYLSELVTWGDPALGLQVFGTADGMAYRPIDVTTTDDFVPGSLRAAMDDANRGPCPCRIGFRIPPPAPPQGWFTIAPLAPLPPLKQADRILVDGNRQTSLTGDTNPRGPEIEVNGSRTSGDGFTIDSVTEIRGLAINGFSRHAINSESAAYVHDNYIGTDPTGEIAVPNLRGIWTAPGYFNVIDHNVISGNTYSGVFDRGGATITSNRIGVTASGRPLGNGASGIFTIVGATIEKNVIAHNHDFAVGAPSGLGPFVGENSMFDNGGLSVDIGMDGPTPHSPPQVVLGNAAPVPHINDAYWDGTSTVVVANIDEPSSPTPPLFPSSQVTSVTTIDFYESAGLNRAGYAEAEHFLGSAVVIGTVATFRVPQDLRGHYITAIGFTKRNFFAEFTERGSSELSLGIRVR